MQSWFGNVGHLHRPLALRDMVEPTAKSKSARITRSLRRGLLECAGSLILSPHILMYRSWTNIHSRTWPETVPGILSCLIPSGLLLIVRDICAYNMCFDKLHALRKGGSLTWSTMIWFSCWSSVWLKLEPMWLDLSGNRGHSVDNRGYLFPV